MNNLSIKLVAAVALLTSTAAQATLLTLPNPNPLASGQYNNFTVYSLDLLSKCSAAGDARCLPSGPFPVKSSPGIIADQAVVLASDGGASNFPTPFASGAPADNVFMTPTGNTSSTYVMSDVGGKFTGDLANRWDVKVSTLKSYLGGNDLVFLFDNNQSSNGASQYINLWGQARIVNSAGATVSGMCFELSTGAGCGALAPEPNPVATDFVPVISDFCVDKTTGASYNYGNATNAGDCPASAAHPAGGYQVNNNVSTSTAEFAAYNKTLNDFVQNAANGEFFLSLNIKYTGNDAGAEQLWICSECTIGANDVPEPSSIAMLGLALAALGFVRRK